MSVITDYFIIFWGLFMIVFMAIGGFFMFRKFLKQLPKKDGRSMMDWERYHIEETKHMWDDEQKALLEELVSPVPELFRDVARQTIAGKVGQVALEKHATKITREILLEGYIIGTPKKDHRFLRKKLAQLNIDVAPYEHLFALSKKDYRENWKEKHQQAQKDA